jgi:beta-N-acetylhexosaminidase
MGTHRAVRPQPQLARANSARPGAAAPGHRPYASEYERRSVRGGARSSFHPVRLTKKLLILIASVVVAVAAIVFFAANAAAHRSSAEAGASQPNAGGHAAAGGHPITPVSAALGLAPGAVSPSAAGIAEAKAVLPKLDNYQLAGQRVIYSYSGLTPPSSLLWAISHGRVAGIIFFKDNVGTTAHITAVIKRLQQANAASTNPVRLPLLMMTDQEGGVVRRLDGPPTLSAKQMGASAHPQQTTTNEGQAAGKFLHGVGINVNLAPVLDVYRMAGNFIDQFGRSFSKNPSKVAKLGELFATAEQQQGVAATVKHFPGLGAATKTQNTDQGPVTLKLTLNQIRTIDELPYQSAVAAKVKLAMVSWAIYPALAKSPAGLSVKIVHGELRSRLKFGGVTITDALGAGALKNFGSTGHRAVLAAKTGMDLILCASENTTEGVTARDALRAYYLSADATAQANFKAEVERVVALRATL